MTKTDRILARIWTMHRDDVLTYNGGENAKDWHLEDFLESENGKELRKLIEEKE